MRTDRLAQVVSMRREDDPMTTDPDRQEVQALIEAWNDSVNANDSQRILTLVSDDLSSQL
jgi:hypothetical protein